MGSVDIPPLVVADLYGSPAGPATRPACIWRVRWTRQPRFGDERSRIWNGRYFATKAAAIRLAEHHLESGADVELSTFTIEELDTLRYQPAERRRG